MSKYINADDVYDGMRKHRFEAKYITIGEFVDHLPSADVVEVVRCKDCKYCEKAEEKYEGDRFEPTDIVCTVFNIYTHPNEFCSYGERKETDEKHN